MGEPALSLDQAKAEIEKTTHPRVTEDSIRAKIKSVDYFNHHTLTICIIEMENGFKSTGVSAPASPENFRIEVGKRYAFDNAFKPLWQLEGYLLCDKLSKT